MKSNLKSILFYPFDLISGLFRSSISHSLGNSSCDDSSSGAQWSAFKALVFSALVFSTAIGAANEGSTYAHNSTTNAQALASGSLQTYSNPKNKILIITDIDDTIKVAGSYKGLYFMQYVNSKLQYTGMAQLLSLLKTEWQDKLEIAYVTNAQKNIETSRIAFLEHHNFLKGPIYYKPSRQSKNHKYDSVRKAIAEANPSHVILLGDNASKDAKVYTDLKPEFETQNISFSIYIHRMFSQETEVDHSAYFSYITSLELAYKLAEEGFISTENELTFFYTHYPFIEQEILEDKSPLEDALSFPHFMSCSLFKWTLPFMERFEMLKAYLNTICSESYAAAM